MSQNTEPESTVTTADTEAGDQAEARTENKTEAATGAESPGQATDEIGDKPDDRADGKAADKADGKAARKAAKAQEKAAKAGDQAGGPSRSSKTVPAVLAVLCVLMAVVVALLGVWAYSNMQAQKADAAALESARTRAPVVLSYAPATVDKDIATARAQLSGTFAEQFDQLVNQVVLPATKQQGLASKTEVTHAALMESQGDQPGVRDVLVFLQQVVSGNNQQPQQGIIQVKVTVTKNPEGQWLVSNLQPI